MLEKKIASILRKKKLTIAVAESCTGGLISHALTNIPGSSSFFLLGAVAYSNDAKIKVLGVNPLTIRQYGAVSQETALELATHVRHVTRAHIGLGVTGIAGPSGGTALKPVGTVFIAVSIGHSLYFKKFFFLGRRLAIKNAAKQAALRLLHECLL